MTSLESLNPSQREAVLTTEGHLLILAGAGSGKTGVLVHRIAHLIQELQVPPSSILGLTFTNKAAEEMRSRVAKRVGSSAAKEITLSTFHSFCMALLRKEISRLGFTKTFTLYDEKDVSRLILQIASEELGEEEEIALQETLAAIKELKARGAPLEEVKEPSLKTIYETLQMAMRAHNALDFDSLLTTAVELLERFPDLLEEQQERFRYIMVDEYQDTNPIQYRLISLLAKKWGNLCVVGDDDQSIYGWRGAEIKQILHFPATKTVKLEKNYRSTSTILEAANSLVSHNIERHDKVLTSHSGAGEPIEIFHAPSEEEEVEGVLSRLLALKEEKGYQWKEIAILYRSNKLARAFELALMQRVWRDKKEWKRGIPYELFGGMEFFERSEIRDLMAYLRIVTNPKDQEALLRIINYPRRGISKRTLDCLTQFNRSRSLPLLHLLKQIAEGSCSLPLTKQGEQGIRQFLLLYEEMLEQFEIKKPSAALEWLIERIAYKEAIETEVKSDRGRAMKWENVQAYIASLKSYEEEEDASLHDFLASALLKMQKLGRKERLTRDALNLMTFHSAKGLEFPALFLVGLEDHLIPHTRSQEEGTIEEERRLLYVAITRAMKQLCLSMAQRRPHHGKLINCNPSRFLFEIPKKLFKITPWKKVGT